MSSESWFHELQGRGLIQDISDEEKVARLAHGSTPLGFYVGFDPTAPSLQLGNLVPLIVAMHLAKAGLRAHILFGGATGSIGDPSGKDKERTLLDDETIRQNIDFQRGQVEQIFAAQGLQAEFLDNRDWTGELLLLDFLRDTGKHFTVNYMVSKEVVKSRLEGHGISFTEFSYMLLQAMDFEYLLRTKDITMQFGGSDQWGNITAGLELIRRKGTGEAVAFSIPLLTNSDGKKFGKSEGGALWLDPERTSPYRLHQFLLNTEDKDVVRYLDTLTFLTEAERKEIATLHEADPGRRVAQERLADSIVSLVHGEEALSAAQKSRAVLFGGSLEGLSEDELREAFEGVPSSVEPRAGLLAESVAECFARSSLTSSRGEAKRLLSQGGGYINGKRIEDPLQPLGESVPLDGKNLLVLRAGKKKYHLIQLQE